MRLFHHSLVAVLLAGACNTDPLTPEERALLDDLALTGTIPASPSNAWADDPRAAALGQQLFFDARFSGPLLVGDDGRNGGLGEVGAIGRVSCASCHDPAGGGADLRSVGPTSLAAGWTGRNAPTVLNSALASTPWFFWDGRKDSLWSQALGPIESSVEHASSRLAVAHLIATHYRAPYEAMFGALPPLDDGDRFPPEGKPGDPAWEGMAVADQHAVDRVFANFGKAIEAYERRLVDRSSPFDRFLAGDDGALSAAAIRGAKLFVGRAACNECHSGASMSDGRFHNHTVPQVGAGVPGVDVGRAGGLARVLADPFNEAGAMSDRVEAGHMHGLLDDPRDVGAFKTPTLRNVALTAPYMHTGGFATLRDVIEWYRDGGGRSGFAGERDPAVRPLRLSDTDVDDLVELLEAMTGDPLPVALVSPPELP